MTTTRSEYGYSAREGDQDVRATFSYPMFQEFARNQQTLSDLFACAPFGNIVVVADGEAELASAFLATGNYHEMLGVRPELGRTLGRDDDSPSADAVAVISDGYWTRRFGRDPNVIGRVVHLNNLAVTIVGVMPKAFTGVQRVEGEAPDFSLPLSIDARLGGQEEVKLADPDRLRKPTYWWLQIMGRLKPGATPQQVEASLAGVFQDASRRGLDSFLSELPPSERSLARNQDRTLVPRLRVSDGSRGIYDVDPDLLRSVQILTIVVALILLIVCANIANLLLSRASARQKEISVRLSLGAS